VWEQAVFNDCCVAPSIILSQGVKEPLHHPFDDWCAGIHAALLDAFWVEGLIAYFRKTGKLFATKSQRGIAATKKGAEKTAFLLQNGV
jgi:hypothetical protein